MEKLISTLKNYGISGEVVNNYDGPLLKIIEFSPSVGTKLKNIISAQEDIRRELGVSSLRIEPSKTSNGIYFQFPKEQMETIDFISIINSQDFEIAIKKYQLPINIGINTKGEPINADLAKMPHLLVGGTTGSGKSVGLNAFILSLIKAKKPSELKLVLIDPKKIEFSIYNNQKYLYCPVVTETSEAIAILAHLAEEMDRRYELFAENLSRNLQEYNTKGDGFLPYIVCVIDEFADLIATDKDVEKDVMRLAQKARAAGIHLILATQRPSVDVVTGVLKANFPTRLAFKVASSADSRTILDTTGAEDLVGRGDGLFLASNGETTRIHGSYMSNEVIQEILAPYHKIIKPLKLDIPNEENKSPTQKLKATKEKPNEGWIRSAIRIWSNLRIKERKMIINTLKNIFIFILGHIFGKRK